MNGYPTETYLPIDVQMWLCQHVSPGAHLVSFAMIAGFVVIIGLTAVGCVCRSVEAVEE